MIDSSKITIREISKKIAKQMIVKHHYSHAWTMCRHALGIFYQTDNEHSFFDSKEEKLIWIDFVKCEDAYSTKLNELRKIKDKYKEKEREKEYLKVIKEIEAIQNQIRIDKIKLKIKAKIQNKRMLI